LTKRRKGREKDGSRAELGLARSSPLCFTYTSWVICLVIRTSGTSSLLCTCVMHVIWYLIPTDQVKSNQVRGLRATFLVLCEYEGTGSCDGAEGRGVGNLGCVKVSSFFSIWFPRKKKGIRTELTGSLPSIFSPSTVQDRSVSEGLLVACSTFDFPSALSVPSFLPRSPPRSPPSSSI
jgi:hypothetical protein